MIDKQIKQIKNAMYNNPYDYKTSKEYYYRDLQQKINDTFEYASDVDEIQEESHNGTLIFEPLLCRVTHVIDPKTGNNLGDDFRDLKFKSLDYKVELGQRYRFSNSDWIVMNTNNYKYVTKSAVVRRCNNELRWVDTNTHKVVSEPCVIDYTMKYANIYFNHTVDITQGTLLITIQNNEYSKQININDRFILGTQVYKVKVIFDALRQSTYIQQDTPLLSLEVYVDTESHDDNYSPYALGRPYNPIYPENIANCNRYKNIFEPSITGDSEVRIIPEKTFITLGETVIYSCYEYQDDIKTDGIFNFIFEGLSEDYFEAAIIDGNNFSITNKKTNVKKPLIVTCKNQNHEKKIDIKLGGLY